MKTIPRERNVAHLWADKQVTRFIRKNFEGKQRRTLRDVYLALCEIDSDFAQHRNNSNFHIPHLGKLCATYAGLTEDTTYAAMRMFKLMGLIDYGQNPGEKGKYGKGSWLEMRKWEDGENYLENLKAAGPPENRERVSLPEPPESRTPVSPLTVKTGNYKNPSGEGLESFQEEDPKTLSPAARGGRSSGEEPSPDIFLTYARRLYHIVFPATNIKRSEKDLQNWARSFRLLHQRDGVSEERIREALAWYRQHIGEPFVKVIECGDSFRKKFSGLERNMKEGSRPPPTRPAGKDHGHGSNGFQNRDPDYARRFAEGVRKRTIVSGG